MPSPVLQALLVALDNAMQGGSLVIDARTLGGTCGEPLLQLLSEQLATTALILDNAVLPAEVTGDTLPVTGERHGVAAAITFQDVSGRSPSRRCSRHPPPRRSSRCFRCCRPATSRRSRSPAGRQR